jgi:tetratricopeptide (TPR) repeat protein
LVLLSAVWAVAALAVEGPAASPFRQDPLTIGGTLLGKETQAAPPVESHVLFCEAVRLKLHERFTEAIEQLKKALGLDKDSAGILYEIGFCYYRLGKNKEASDHLKRSLALDKDNGPAHETLAFVYAALGERDKALDELEAAALAPVRPHNHAGLVQRIALIYERQGDYKNAIKWYRYLVDCGHREPPTYVSLGALQLKERLYDAALWSFRQVIRRTPPDEELPDGISKAYAQLSEKERADAIQSHEAAVAKNPDAMTLEALAIAYQAAGRRKEMAEAVERAAALDSSRTAAQKQFLAGYFEDMGEYGKAIEWRLKILADQKTLPAEALLDLATLYVKHEEMEKAADTFRKAFAADPRRDDLPRRIAACYAELYQWDKAAAVLEDHLKTRKELGPADAQDVFELAEVCQQMGKADLATQRKKQAFGLLAKAVGKSGNKLVDAQIHLTLAELHYADEHPAEALNYLLIAQQLDPDDLKKLFRLGLGYKRVQNWTEAAATFRKYAAKNPGPLGAAALLEASSCEEAAARPEAAATRQKAKELLLKAADAAEKEPLKAALLYAQVGEAELHRNQAKAAIERFNEALRLDPRNYLYHLYLGQCYQLLADWPQAAAHYKSYADAAKPDESLARTVYRLGVAQARGGQAQLGAENKRRAIQMLLDALDALEKEKRGTPAHKAEILRDLAGLYSGEKGHEKGIQAIQRAIALAPSDKRADYQLTLASLLGDAERHDESEKALLEAQKAEPENPAVLNHLGYFYAERGKNLGQAVELVKKALQRDPLNGAYLDSLGWAYFKQGKLQEALDLLLKAVTYDDDAVIRDHLGDACHKLGKIPEAREAWTRALALDPEIKGVGEKLKSTEPKPQPEKKP